MKRIIDFFRKAFRSSEQRSLDDMEAQADFIRQRQAETTMHRFSPNYETRMKRTKEVLGHMTRIASRAQKIMESGGFISPDEKRQILESFNHMLRIDRREGGNTSVHSEIIHASPILMSAVEGAYKLSKNLDAEVSQAAKKALEVLTVSYDVAHFKLDDLKKKK